MAPEQLEGKEADARTDIFAFGCVLYEMATGQKAFSGSSQASLISAILRDEPRPISQVQPIVAAGARPGRADVPRQGSGGALAIGERPEARAAVDRGGLGGRDRRAGDGDRRPHRYRRSSRAGWIVAAVAALAAIALALGARCARRGAPAGSRLRVPRSAAQDELAADRRRGGAAGRVTQRRERRVRRRREAVGALAAHGRRRARRRDRGCDVSVLVRRQPLARVLRGRQAPDDRGHGRPVSGPRRRAHAARRHVGAGRHDRLHAGFPGRHLARAGLGRHAEGAHPGGRVRSTARIAGPGCCRMESTSSISRSSHLNPRSETSGIYVVSVDGGPSTRLLASYGSAQTVPGWLLSVSEGHLVAWPFDADRLTVTGKARRVPADANFDYGTWSGVFSVSQDRVLVYQTAQEQARGQLQWMDPSGRVGDEGRRAQQQLRAAPLARRHPGERHRGRSEQRPLDLRARPRLPDAADDERAGDPDAHLDARRLGDPVRQRHERDRRLRLHAAAPARRWEAERPSRSRARRSASSRPICRPTASTSSWTGARSARRRSGSFRWPIRTRRRR